MSGTLLQKDAMVYFSEALLPSTHERDQYEEVLKLREKYKTKFSGRYANTHKFEYIVTNHLTQLLNDEEFLFKLAKQKCEDSPVQIAPFVNSLSSRHVTSDELKMLREALSNHSTIKRSREINNQTIYSGKTCYGQGDDRAFAKGKHTLDQLLSKGLVEDRGTDGSFFKITEPGYQVLEANGENISPNKMDLSDNAQAMLLPASDPENPASEIIHTILEDKSKPFVAGKAIFTTDTAREYAKWLAAIKELKKYSLVNDDGHSIFSYTDKGYQWSDILRTAQGSDKPIGRFPGATG